MRGELLQTLETLKGSTLDSKINHSAYYNSEKDDVESDPKSDPLVANHTSDRKKGKVADTDTTHGNYPQNYCSTGPSQSSPTCLTCRFRMGLQMLEGPRMRTIWFFRGDHHGRGAQQKACCLISCGGKPGGHGRDDYMGRKYFQNISRFTSPVNIGGGTTVSPTRIGSQEIIIPRSPIGHV